MANAVVMEKKGCCSDDNKLNVATIEKKNILAANFAEIEKKRRYGGELKRKIGYVMVEKKNKKEFFFK